MPTQGREILLLSWVYAREAGNSSASTLQQPAIFVPYDRFKGLKNGIGPFLRLSALTNIVKGNLLRVKLVR
jgi:hypothetical protein